VATHPPRRRIRDLGEATRERQPTATLIERPAQIDPHHEDVIVRLIGRLRRRRKATRAGRGDSDLHHSRAEAYAEIELRDINDMLDAVAERRRRAGRRAIGEELADDLSRSTSHDGD
jgi:hypothetical protein